MKKDYDDKIKKHYDKVADELGDQQTSTMLDNFVREKETQTILDFVGIKSNNKKSMTIVDIGCGNGYTLSRLISEFEHHQHRFIGIEYNDKLRYYADKRFKNNNNVQVFKGDIRNSSFLNNIKVDIIICQRVVINLLNRKDQDKALENIIDSAKPGGYLLFIEAFKSRLDILNEARSELNLKEIEQPYHNLYLSDNFFNRGEIVDLNNLKFDITHNQYQSNFLSTHYFISRALYPAIINDVNLKRNSHLAKFFSLSLPQNIGDYSPLKLKIFKKHREIM
jgi:SAM-dependent methyltransferase